MRFLNKNQIFFKKQSTLQPTTVAQAAHTKKRNKITRSNKQQQKKTGKRLRKSTKKGSRQWGARSSADSPLPRTVP